jgi:hypothetical protein
MNILFGWELGAGQGHIQRLVALAQKLETYGFTPIFALKSYQLEGVTFPWQRLIPPRLPFSGRDEAFTFADILANFGFDDVNVLRAHLQAWEDIIQRVQPALVITDHAPGLVLAAQQRVPTIVIGSHFAVPPPIEMFPIIRFPAPSESLVRQQAVSDAVRKVSKTDAPVGRILNGDRSFIFSLPELDCYRFWRTNPEYVSAHLTPLPLCQASNATAAWAYLASDYAFRDLVLQTLRPACDFKPLHEALAQQALVIHHGGLTTAIACLLTGIPQLVLPRYLEQQLTAIALQRLGVAQMLVTPTWENLLITQAQTFALAGTAHALALKLTQWNQHFLPAILQACLAFTTI